MEYRNSNCDEYGVEYVSGEGNPKVSCNLEQVGEVFCCRSYNIELRREYEQLAYRLERLNYRVVKREDHEYSQKRKQYAYCNISAQRAVYMLAL